VRKVLVITVLGLGLTACLPAELSQGPGLTGTYVVNGVDPNGTEYTGRVLITAGGDADEVVLEWVITGAIIRGEGTIDGDTLIVDWETVESPRGTSRGSAEYEILADGRLVGTRLIDGVDEPGTEEIFPEP
jgi:hypothetical protein